MRQKVQRVAARFFKNEADGCDVVVHLLQPCVAGAAVVLAVHNPRRVKNQMLLEALEQRVAGHGACEAVESVK